MSQSKPFALSRQAVWSAYNKVKANKGSAGIDGQSIEEFDKNLAGEPIQNLESNGLGQLYAASSTAC